MTKDKPSKICVPLMAGESWHDDGAHIYQEKLDGEFTSRNFGGYWLAGETMRAGNFIAFDLLGAQGDDIRKTPLRERWEMLLHIAPILGVPIVEHSQNGGQLLRRVLARGGEGVCRKSLDAFYGDAMEACKRVITLPCVVTRIGDTQAVEIADAQTGDPRGHVKLGGGKVERVRVGSIIKVEGLELTAAGKIREPRPCKDSATSWLIKY